MSPFSRAVRKSGTRVRSSVLRRSKVTFSIWSLPASILEKSRMSLMTTSRVVGGLLAEVRFWRCSGLRSVSRASISHPHDAVHGGADLVTHVARNSDFNRADSSAFSEQGASLSGHACDGGAGSRGLVRKPITPKIDTSSLGASTKRSRGAAISAGPRNLS